MPPDEALFRTLREPAVTARIADFAAAQRWYRKKGQARKSARLEEMITLGTDTERVVLVLLRIELDGGESEVYAVPLLETGADPADLVPVDAVGTPAFARAMLEIARSQSSSWGQNGMLVGARFDGVGGLLDAEDLGPELMAVEQTNSTIRYGTRVLGKFLRSVDEDESIELEFGRFFAGLPQRPPVAALLGAVFRRRGDREQTLMLFSELVPHEKTGFDLVCDELVLASSRPASEPPPANERLVAFVELIARRTAEIHIALASAPERAGFEPEPFTDEHRRLLLLRAEKRLARLARELPRVAAVSGRVGARLRALLSAPIDAVRIRCHGDYHLGQLLFTGTDVVVVDFEGEPARSAAERREKRTPLADVASMLRSFDYAFETVLRREPASEGLDRARELERLYHELAGRFVRAYLAATTGESFIPRAPGEVFRLLELCLLDKCLYEISYELDHRPSWLAVPLAGLERLMAQQEPETSA